MKDERDETCGIYQEKKNVYKILVGKPEVKWPPARLRSRWKDNIQMVITQTELETWSGFIWLKIRKNGALM
jgi:hypothetical protein